MGRRLQQAAAPAPAVFGPVNGQGEDSVDVLYTLIAPTSDAIYPTLGSANAVYNAEVEADLLAQGWQVRHAANAAQLSGRTWSASYIGGLSDRGCFGNLQVAAFAMQIMLAEGALAITSRLNVEPMAAASIALTVRCLWCCFCPALV